ncbi:MAG TPA: YtxH domain-containing protein [Chitinophagaceae bacterium]
MNNLKMVVFTLAGLVAGIGLGVLLAPAAGTETRRKLKYSTSALRKKLGLDGEDFADSEMEMDAVRGRNFGLS